MRRIGSEAILCRLACRTISSSDTGSEEAADSVRALEARSSTTRSDPEVIRGILTSSSEIVYLSADVLVNK